jgi:uncharacterized protein
MQISLDRGTGSFAISAYGDGFVIVNEQRIETSCIVMPEHLSTDWPPQRSTELESAHMVDVAAHGAEIIIVGTGATQVFPSPDVLAPLVTHGVGFEIMDTRAACRTYNILMAEGRNVVAALIMIAR